MSGPLPPAAPAADTEDVTMNLDELLGIDPDNPEDRHAEILVEEDDAWIRELVALRLKRGLDQQQVAEIMGIDQSGVSRIESGTRDLHLSTLRRYAFAVGAVVHHDVEDVRERLRRERIAAAAEDVLPSMASSWDSARKISWSGLRLGGPR